MHQTHQEDSASVSGVSVSGVTTIAGMAATEKVGMRTFYQNGIREALASTKGLEEVLRLMREG